MDYLSQLESRSIYIIREAYNLFSNIALLWSIGKDSTSLLWITRKAFFGEIPFPVIHIDTSFKFEEIYEFRDKYAGTWQLDLHISRNEEALRQGVSPKEQKLKCCNALKTEALKASLKECGFDALLLGIRRDEHGIRAKERYFSPRDTRFTWNYTNQPAELWDSYSSNSQGGHHFRVHPLLHWTEVDIWRYIQRERIPIVDLYFAKHGLRYRSIGCRTCCKPVPSKASTIGKIIREVEASTVSERVGRAQDKEDVYAMQKLRSLGYM